MKIWIIFWTIFHLLTAVLSEIINLPQVPLQVNETYYLEISKYFEEPNINVKVIASESNCTSLVNITPTETIKKEFNGQISSESFQVAFPYSSKILHAQISNNKKQYFLALFDNKFDFFIYDITEYNILDGKVDPVKLIMKVSLIKPNPTTIYEYSAWQGLSYREDVIFYSVCWNWQDQVFIASIDIKGLEGSSPSSKPYSYQVYQRHLKGSEYRPGSKYTIFNYQYIFYPKFSDDTSIIENFCFWSLIEVKESDPHHGWLDFMIPQMKAKIESLLSNTTNPFVIGDIRMVDNQYLFMTDNTYGIFVFRFHKGTFKLNGEPYLYKINSNPNRIHIETPNNNEYQIMITTVKANEVLIFMPNKYGANWLPSEVLKLDRIHAFLLQCINLLN